MQERRRLEKLHRVDELFGLIGTAVFFMHVMTDEEQLPRRRMPLSAPCYYALPAMIEMLTMMHDGDYNRIRV